MTPDWISGPAVYELTLAGAIGPVLRFALKPHQVAQTQICTILRTRASADRDLVDLMLRLESRGLKVEDVSRVDTRRGRARSDSKANRGVNVGVDEPVG
jgi:hypothetical protein